MAAPTRKDPNEAQRAIEQRMAESERKLDLLRAALDTLDARLKTEIADVVARIIAVDGKVTPRA